MRPAVEQSSRGAVSAAVALGAGIFVLDLLVPLGVAAGLLYVVPVLLSLRSPQRQVTFAIAGGATLLTILGFWLSPESGIWWIAIANRLLALLAIWATALLSVQHKESVEAIRTLHGMLPICASCKKVRDDRGYWEGLEQYVETHSKTLFSHRLCPTCLEKWYPELHPELAARDLPSPEPDSLNLSSTPPRTDALPDLSWGS